MKTVELMRRLAFNMRVTATEMLKEGDAELTEHADELVGAAAQVDTWIAGLEER